MPVKPFFSLPDNANSSTKFSLFLKTRELQQIATSLKSILLKPQKDRAAWLEEYGEIINEAFDSYVDESNFILDSVSFDEESLALSQELVMTLRDALTMIEGISDDSEAHLQG